MQIKRFESGKSGPTLCLLGRVHGDEPCGTDAINRLIADIDAKRIAIEKGNVVCVPLVNAAAAAKNTRFLDRNLNRIFGVTDTSDIEGKVAEDLKPVLRDCDYLLDLHSYTAGGPAFTFASDDAETLAFAAALPGAVSITGFQDCYEKAFPDKPSAGMGTTEYARAHGAKAVTFECGQHRAADAADKGYAAIMATLAHLSMAQVAVPPHTQARHIRMMHVFVKSQEGAFVKPWAHLAPITAGETFATFQNGSIQKAPHEGFIILPKEAVAVGTEWGYLAV